MSSPLAYPKILDAGAVGIQQYPDVNNAFLTGKVPMVQMGPWYQQYASVNSLTAALAGAGVPSDTKKVTILPIAFPDVAGKGNPSTLFTDPDAGQAVTKFLQGALKKTGGEMPDVPGWYARFIGGVALPHASVFSYLVTFGELAVARPWSWDC